MKFLIFICISFLSLTLFSCVETKTPEIPLTDDTIVPFQLGIQPEDTIYQLQVYAFNDSNNDGVGDFKGIALKASYLYHLGVDAIWLSPIHPSPSYHHYDVTDYFSADSLYVVDNFTFEDMLEVLHAYGIDVILDIVINHSSEEHPYFIEAIEAFRTNTPSPYIDYYILSNTRFTHPTLGYASAIKDGVHYDAFFGLSHMPAFNFDHEPVRNMFLDIFRFWLDKGVAGFRLDAAKHVYDDLNKNNDLFKYFVNELKKTHDDVYFVNEIWASEQEVISYHASLMNNFNFDTRQVIAASLSGDTNYARFLENFQNAIRRLNPKATEAHFISNHDVGRLPFGYSERHQKMMAALLILSPGNSYMYYGDEISLTGARILNPGFGGYEDASYRTPMLWDDWSDIRALYIKTGTGNAIREASTQSRITVEASLNDPNSLLLYYQKLNQLKSENPLLSTGTLKALNLNPNLISYQVSQDNSFLIVNHNLTENPITITIEGARIKGFVSDTVSPILENNQLTIPAYSSILLSSDRSQVIEAPVDDNPVFLRGTFSNWIDQVMYQMQFSQNRYTFNLNISQEAQFKVFANNTWYGFDFVTSYPGIDLRADEQYNNIIIPAGNYIITFTNETIQIQKKA
jgi:alpha-amylase